MNIGVGALKQVPRWTTLSTAPEQGILELVPPDRTDECPGSTPGPMNMALRVPWIYPGPMNVGLRMSSAPWNSSSILSSSLSDPYASEARSLFPQNHVLALVQFLDFPALRILKKQFPGVVV